MVEFRVAFDEEIRLLSVFPSPIHCLVGRVLVIDRNSSISLRNTFNMNEHSHLRMTRTCNTNNVVRTTRTRPQSGKSYSVSRSNYSVLFCSTDHRSQCNEFICCHCGKSGCSLCCDREPSRIPVKRLCRRHKEPR